MPKPMMRRKLDAAIRDADHLNGKDLAAVALARSLADALDAAYLEDNGGATYRKYCGWVAPHLLATMRSLGLTPDSGGKAGWLPPTRSARLAELRAGRFRGPDASTDYAS